MLLSSVEIPPQPSGWPIYGHERAVRMLRTSIRSKRLAHAYLFTGPEGVGKRTLALTLAMTLNCEGAASDGEWPDVPCGLCPACSRTRRGAHPDLIEISLETQAASLAESGGKGKTPPPKELRIDVIREMQATVGLSPYSGRWKVYVIGDADRLNEEAANCMLKTLEEPPDHTLLILLASDEAAVLPTISSRCLQVALRPLSRRLVAQALVEAWGAEREQAETLAALSGGRLGYAVRLLGDPAAMGRRQSALQELALLVGAPVTERINAATNYAKRFTDARTELYEMLATWEGWWRDVLMVRASTPELAANVDQAGSLRSLARRTPPHRAAQAVRLIQDTRQQLLENVNPRLALEALTLGLP